MTSSIVSNGSTPSTLDISWDDFLDGAFPATPAPPRFTRTVHEVTAAAKAALPELNGRVDRARDLVLAGAVFPHEDGRFTVTSQSVRGKSYRVDGSCACQDAEKDPRCKHVLATWIWRKAQDVLVAQDAAEAPEALTPAPGPQAPSLPPLPEAPASVNVDVPISGRLARITLRDHDESRLLARLEALLERFPVVASTAAAEAEAPAPSLPDEGWCVLHSTPMRHHTNPQGSWWSHKLANGTWCRGKVKA